MVMTDVQVNNQILTFFIAGSLPEAGFSDFSGVSLRAATCIV